MIYGEVKKPADRGLPALAWRPVSLIATVAGAALLAASGRYGYHRDELYYLVAGHHLAWGYDDQPPMVAVLARASSTAFGGSLTGLRLASDLAVAATVLLTALIARELGGGRRAQAIAAGAYGVATLTIIAGHLLSTTTFDLLFWSLITWLVARWVRGRDDRLWPLVGAVAGLGLLNKNLVAFLAFGLAAGVAAAGPRELLGNRWLWAGAVIALVIWLPNLAWQASHGWPQFDMAREIAGNGDDGGRAGFLPFQFLLLGPLMAPIWIAGLWRLFRDPGARPFRLFAWAYVALTVVFLVTGGKNYYVGGLYPVLIASGGIAVDGWLSRCADVERGGRGGRGGRRLRTGLLAAAFGLSIVATTILGLPVYPLSSFAGSPEAAVNYDARETIGWPRLVMTVAGVYRALPPAEQARVTIFTANYGEAGAIDRYGRKLGLPEAYSGHNAFHRWGPPPEKGGPVVVVGDFPESYLKRFWDNARVVARNDNGHRVDNEEQHVPIWVCDAQKRPWRDIWPELQHFG
jgi:4-amino-4-deoxy-L-arabinose transferase-like glycosyltransferase